MDKKPDLEAGSCYHNRIVPTQQACAIIQRIRDSPTFRRAERPDSYPPVASIPRTSPERLAQASADNTPESPAASTVLYLAYGSNLSAETFLGWRGIRPLSQINVSAPAFDLAFDLPGLPYMEPCFANTTPRKLPIPIPKPPKIPGDGTPGLPQPPPSPPLSSGSSSGNSEASPPSSTPKWTKGLYGVVYEVTPDDYATIIKTERGLSQYQDVLTPCVALPPPPSLHVPEKPPTPPELPPRPFLAHTLYAPRPPPPPHEGDGDRRWWWQRLLYPVRRPDPTYAQPSPRYLRQIRDGAREHGLPAEYRAYLAGLRGYEATTRRQAAGRLLVGVVFLPLVAVLVLLDRLLGEGPRWLAVARLVFANLLWIVYDAVLRPIFGDGERTMAEDDGGDESGNEGARRRAIKERRMTRLRESRMEGGDEKSMLLRDW
ncbi:hypothetical protein F4779DRAFT_438281 [Xylariaceae sp. FL0662B]|nr:hypothetical protein F4779DRAFT_438281 [Xylariaceae sp. FL0662B]